MSTYLKMWYRIRYMGLAEVEYFLGEHSPPEGRGVNFHGVLVNDVDLVEALKFQRDDILQTNQTMEDYNRMDVQRVLEQFVDEGLIDDHRQPNFD